MVRLMGTVALALVLSPLVVSAQLASADAGSFMGSRTLSLESPQGPFEQSLGL